MNLTSVTLTAAVAAGWLLTAGPAAGECVSPGYNSGGGRFCNGCRYQSSITLGRAETCERPHRFHLNPNQIEFLSHRMIQRAKHGIPGITNTSLAYRPSKGYVGRDEFVIEAGYRQGTETGKFTVHFDVAVK